MWYFTHSRLVPKLMATLLFAAVLSGSGELGWRHAAAQRLLDSAQNPGCAVIPAGGDWEYVGTAFGPGREGEFDRYLWGGFGGSAIRFGGEVMLYYQGAYDYSEVQQSVTYRSIGLATSSDGVSFRKDPASPVLEWTPQMGEEEGVTSVAVALHPDGRMIAFYGANTRIGPISVNADGRWASSVDGRVFVDRGVALDHADPDIFGSGDELFPVAATYHRSVWYLHYIPNGERSGDLGVAWGTSPDALHDTAAVQIGGEAVRAWGMQSVIQLCDDTFALFLNDVRSRTMSVRVTDLRAPSLASEPLETYRFEATESRPEFVQGAVLLDREAGYWYLFYRSGERSRYDIRRADYRTW